MSGLVDELAGARRSRCCAGAMRALTSASSSTSRATEISIGRYVLSGGELAAMVVCDAILRKLPGALGHEESAVQESFSPALGGNPEYPHYTRPAEYRGWRVPEVLLGGHHEEIQRWRLDQARHRNQ
jgi:tRNA (guanine37-N1)-methyltransferase